MTARAHRSIGEVLSELQDEFPDVTISKIRFLESQGLIDPERTPSGYRKFYDDDVERLRWILARQRDQFLPLKVIKAQLDEGAFGPGDEPDPVASDDGDRAAPDGRDDGTSDGVGAVPAPVPESNAGRFEHDAILAAVREVARSTGPPRAGRVRPAPEPQDGEPGPEVAPPHPVEAGPLRSDLSTVDLSFEDLGRASGLSPRELTELERYGLIHGRPVGPVAYYDAESVAVARLAAAFGRHGIGPRHLRMYKVAAEREAGVFEQVVSPLLRRGRPDGRVLARDQLIEMARLGEAMRAAMLRVTLRELG